jgi:hypothetical protein
MAVTIRGLLPLLLLFALPSRAQTTFSTGGNITSGGANCTTATNCVSIQLPSSAASLSITISGTWSATLTLEYSADGINWTTATTTTTNGTSIWPVAALTTFRVRASSYTSGNAGILFIASTGAYAIPVTGSVDASSFTGTHWTDKLVSAYGSTLCSSGCTIVIPDSIADNGAATTPTIPSNVTVVFPGRATFTFCEIDTGKFAKIYAFGAVLAESGSGCLGIVHSGATATMQDYDHFILAGVRVNCASQTNSTGISNTPSSAGAGDVLNSVSVTGCTTVGINLSNVQFGNYYDLDLEQNYVNMKLYNTGNAGSSNTFYSPKFASNSSGVNVIVYNSASAQIATGNTFINPQFQNGSIASLAVIGNATCGPVCTSVHIIGSSPELNGGGAASVTIDGNIIPQSGFLYQSYSEVTLKNPDFEDASATIDMNLVNSSTLTVENPQGFGAQFSQLALTDSTSTVSITGTLATNGTYTGVVAYPSNITADRGAMAGAPIFQINNTIPNAYTGNPLTPPFSSTTGTTSNATATDALYGTVNTVTFAGSIGSSSTNEIQIANAVPNTTSVTSDYLFSILVKASVTTAVSFYSQYSGGNSGFDFIPVARALTLQAGQWTRVVMYSYGIGSGLSAFLEMFPLDTAGATVSFTGLESLAYPSGTNATTGQQDAFARAQVLQSGAVNPNGFNSVSGAALALGPVTVASLPAAAAGNKGQIRPVSDSTSVATEGQTCVGSSTNTALAFSNGTVWKCF